MRGAFERFAAAASLGRAETLTELQLRLAVGRRATRDARRALDPLAERLDPELLHDARLLVTELVSNSVRHGPRAPTSPIELEVAVDGDRLYVEVRDAGDGFDLRSVPEPDPSRPGGWGLCLVDTIADRWGADGRDGTRVWFELRRRSAFA